MTDTPGTLEERLPCDVLVQPATLIERGCKIETLLECIELRRERSEKGPPLNDILSKRQADEIASLRARVGELLSDAAQTLSDNEAMRSALQPFALLADKIRPDDPDNDRPAFARNSDYRRARQALKDTPDA